MRPDPDRDFSYQHYRTILRAIRASHDVISFRDAAELGPTVSGRRFVILRHDVEISLSAARRMAEIDAEEGVASTFFLLLTGDYNCFEEEGAADIRHILSCGHSIGLHYDGGLMERLGVDPLEAVHRQIALLESMFATNVSVMSAHMPMRAGNALTVPGILNVYDRFFFGDMKYVSDSIQTWREGVVTGLLPRYDRLQLLLHECNWSEDGRRWDQIMHDEAAQKFARLSERANRNIALFHEGLRSRAVRDPLFRERMLGDGTPSAVMTNLVGVSEDA